MCNFFSAIALRDGSIRWHWALDSHSDLLTYYGIADTSEARMFAKVELVPGDDWTDPETWAFRIDEDVAPSWWADVAANVEREMRRTAAKFVLKDVTRRLIVDGVWIVAGASELVDVRGGRILCVGGSATIIDVRGSATIRNVGGSASLDESAKSRVVKP